jgi:dodecin
MQGRRLYGPGAGWAGPVRAGASKEEIMAVASVSKITASSTEGFDAAVREGLERSSKTLRGITGLHVLEQKASVSNSKVSEYRVTMEVTFILEG